MKPLVRHGKINRRGPLVFIIMDGMGIGNDDDGNALYRANTPVISSLMASPFYRTLKAHGTAVGLPADDDMGNSEVGHNALGAGRVFNQGAKLVGEAIESGAIFQSDTWNGLLEKPKTTGAALHFIGLLSDGNVHSHINHLLKMINQCASEGVQTIRIHILLDGRDVPATSAPLYVEQLEKFLDSHRNQGRDYRIASGGGRMVTTMDRYEADWAIVKRGWDAHVRGTARPFSSASEALETFYREDPDRTDQNLPPFTICDDNGPVGPVRDGDSVVFFNFRGDRAIEISRAFDDVEFSFFDRGHRPDVFFAGMMEYDGDLKIPSRYLVFPPHIDKTISEYLVHSGVRQFAISETQKFGHVTYFWNGNRSGMFDDTMEEYVEIPSDRVLFNERPWMKGAEITDRVIDAINKGDCPFIRLNYPNGDMVGHTGDMDAAIIAAETVDLCLKRLLKCIRDHHGIAVITADHGNLDEMFEMDKKTGTYAVDPTTGLPRAKTAHTLNPVPFCIVDSDWNGEYSLADVENAGLANVAATLLTLLGFTPPSEYFPSLVTLKDPGTPGR
jgi:2,3-bisphosphoglycerate-independent phosphoglycerate mutase